MKKKKTNLNDGYATVYVVKKKKTDFNAEVTAKAKEDLMFLMEMAYQEQYKRDQDYEFAESTRHSLSMKIKMRLCDEIKKEHKIVIDGVLYNPFKIDFAKDDRCMYLYLEEERKIAE